MKNKNDILTCTYIKKSDHFIPGKPGRAIFTNVLGFLVGEILYNLSFFREGRDIGLFFLLVSKFLL